MPPEWEAFPIRERFLYRYSNCCNLGFSLTDTLHRCKMLYTRPCVVLSIIPLVLLGTVWAQRNTPPTQQELDEISARGHALQEYDQAAWHGTDAVLALKPAPGEVQRYIARKRGAEWTVYFGRFSPDKDKFNVAYEAIPLDSSNGFKAVRIDPATVVDEELNAMARASATALDAFKDRENGSYNVSVLPAPEGKLFVYILPATSENNVSLLGGDLRDLVSGDGKTILETRRLHHSILRFENSKTEAAGFHTAVMDDIPEDTDVFFVLNRQPQVPEYLASKKYFYIVKENGTIQFIGETDKVLASMNDKRKSK